MQCILHSQTIPPCASFTLPFVSIPPSISKTWLKCSSSKHLCWTLKKTDSEMGGENEAEKVKRNFYSVRGAFHLFHHSQPCEKHRHSNYSLYRLYQCLTSPPTPGPLIPEDNPTAMQYSIAFPEQHFTHIFFQSVVKIPTAPFSPITLFVVYRGAAWETERKAWGAR